MCAPSLTGMREGSELGDEHWIPAGLVIHPGSQQQKPEDQGWVPVGAGEGGPCSLLPGHRSFLGQHWILRDCQGPGASRGKPGGHQGHPPAFTLAQHKAPKTSMAAT